MRVRSLLALVAALGFTGCAHSIHQYQVTAGDLSSRALASADGKVIQAEAEQFVVLYFATDTAYVDAAYKKLLDQCPKGQITGIHTRYSTSLGFLSYRNKIHMQGRCLASR